jgi:hypothetical protein
MIFQTDRFISLMMGTPYAVFDTECNISFKSENPMQRLAVLVGKVIDRTKTPRSTSYSSILETDEELINFGSQMIRELWEHPPPSASFVKTSLKSPEAELPILFFYQARLMLHLPWMLRSLNEAGFEYSRSGCFEAARDIIHLFKDNRVTDNRVGMYKCAPIDLVAFVGAAILCLGQLGYAPGVDDASRSEKDQELVQSVIGVFQKMRTNIASQSIDNLKELIKLQDEWDRGKSVPSRISIPFLGEVSIPEKVSNHFEEHFPVRMAGSIVVIEPKSGIAVDQPTPQTTFAEPVIQNFDRAGRNNFPHPWAVPYSTPSDLATFTFVPHDVESGLIANPSQLYTVGSIS